MSVTNRETVSIANRETVSIANHETVGIDVDDPDSMKAADELIESAEIDTEAAGDVAALRIVRGNPADADIAALIAVLSAAQGSSSPTADSNPPELWGTPTSMHRTFAPFSPYSYQASRRF